MNDDLSLLVSVLSKGTLLKIALQIPHGMNDFAGWGAFKEEDVRSRYKDYLPSHCQGDILAVEEIFHVEVKNVSVISTPLKGNLSSSLHMQIDDGNFVGGVGFREAKPLVCPMVELNNGDIVQFMAYADGEYNREIWRVFNDHDKRYLYLTDKGKWATREGNILPGIKAVKEIK